MVDKLLFCAVLCTTIMRTDTLTHTINFWFRVRLAFCQFFHFVLVLFAFMLGLVLVSTKPRDWLGRTF